MTCCIAALCDNGKTLILIADRMIGTWAIESELEISKLRKLSEYWWILFAGDDITPVFDIIDYTKAAILKKCRDAKVLDDASIPVSVVMDALRESHEKKRLDQAEALFLSPIGWDIATFYVDGHNGLPDFLEIKAKIEGYQLGVEFLVGGFSDATGYVLSLVPRTDGGIVKRHDVPGFYSIGSGATGAGYMLYYRELSYKTAARKALYYAMEAKLFGEQAGGVSEGTDVYVATSDGKFISLDEKKTVEKKLVRVWEKLKPRWIQRESADILNDIPELVEFPRIEVDEDGKPFPMTKRSAQAPPESNSAQ
jgi:hypothetical protein